MSGLRNTCLVSDLSKLSQCLAAIAINHTQYLVFRLEQDNHQCSVLEETLVFGVVCFGPLLSVLAAHRVTKVLGRLVHIDPCKYSRHWLLRAFDQLLLHLRDKCPGGEQQLIISV